jgi:sec-independent protein translocase protein TatA
MDDLFAPSHLILLVIIGLLVFGPGRLPELGASLGKAIREFRGSMAGITSAVDDVKSSVRSVAEMPAPEAPKPESQEPGKDGTAPPAA